MTKEYEQKYAEELGQRNEETMQQNLDLFRQKCEESFQVLKARGSSGKEIAEDFAAYGLLLQEDIKRQLERQRRAAENSKQLVEEKVDVKKKLSKAMKEQKSSLIKQYGYREYVLDEEISHNLVDEKVAEWYLDYLNKLGDVVTEYILKAYPKFADMAAEKGLTVLRDEQGKPLGIAWPGTEKVELT